MSKTCETFRELFPWYAGGNMDAAERSRVEGHLEGCAKCRAELAQTLEVARAAQTALSGLPEPGEHVWAAIASRIQSSPLARVDVGSFLLGISVWLTVRGRQVLLRGDLRLLGRRYPLFAEEA